jgi:hypothetical protein
LHLSPRHNDPLAENRSIAYLSFFDELRMFGFVEGQNLKVDGGGYGLRESNFPCIHRALTEDVICRRALE